MVRSCRVDASIGGAVLAVLLATGCGGGDDDAAASPSSAASPAAPASASVAAPVSPEPSAAPGEAATSAEYVPASLEAPAQNVPKPVMPELAKEESRDGAQAFLDYWSDAMWYAYQTGDTSYAREITSEHCAACVMELDDVASVYEEGNWMAGGRPAIELQNNSLIRANDGIYKPLAKYSGEGGILFEDSSPVQEVSASIEESTLVYLDYVDNRWIYITMAPVAGE